MSANQDIAARFEEMAALLEITGANAFRVNAFRRAARACEGASVDLGKLARQSPAELEKLDGIGGGTAARIVEFVSSGEIADLTALRNSVPTGLPALLGLQGLGPKTVKRLWEEAQVVDLASLRTAIDDGRIASMAGMGAKKIEGLRGAIATAEFAMTRWRLDRAQQAAEAILERLRELPSTIRAAFAGSTRRGRETVGDIDILVSTTAPEAAADEFCVHPGVAAVLARGPTRCSVRLADGLQADLRMVEDTAFGAALLYFTGSKEHNVRLRERALARSQTLNEYGLFPDDGQPTPQSRGITPVAAATEEQIYAALGLPWIPPELREDRGELELTTTPRLVETADIRAELHSHTTASDGHLSLRELVEAAKARGFHTIAVTDHSVSSVQANGLSIDRLLAHIDAVREVEQQVGGIRVLAGSEVDIHSDGHLDYPDEILARLDWVVASPHAALKQDSAKATERLLRAIRHPLVHLLGHPTGRIVLGRTGLEPDMDELWAAAVECHTALEINSHPSRLDLRDTHVRQALGAGCLLAIDCDVHWADDFNNLRFGVATGRRGGLSPDRCLNCLDAAALEAFRLRKRR